MGLRVENEEGMVELRETTGVDRGTVRLLVFHGKERYYRSEVEVPRSLLRKLAQEVVRQSEEEFQREAEERASAENPQLEDYVCKKEAGGCGETVRGWMPYCPCRMCGNPGMTARKRLALRRQLSHIYGE